MYMDAGLDGRWKEEGHGWRRFRERCEIKGDYVGN